MAKNDKETKVELFFPYYINQSRLCYFERRVF